MTELSQKTKQFLKNHRMYNPDGLCDQERAVMDEALRKHPTALDYDSLPFKAEDYAKDLITAWYEVEKGYIYGDVNEWANDAWEERKEMYAGYLEDKTYRGMLKVAIQAKAQEPFNDILPHCQMESMPDKQLDKLITGAVYADNTDATQVLVHEAIERDGMKEDFKHDWILVTAAGLGRIEMVKDLLEIPSVRANAYDGLYEAAGEGRIECVQAILPYADAKQSDSGPLRYAANEGRWDVVKELIPHSDPSASDSYALRCASSAGRGDVVRELLPHSDPKAEDSRALFLAAKGASKSEHERKSAMVFGNGNDYEEIVKTLLPHSDSSGWTESQWSEISPEMKSHIEIYEERRALERALPQVHPPQQSQERSRERRL